MTELGPETSGRLALVPLIAGIVLLTVTACSGTGPRNLTDAKALIQSCHGPVFSYVAIDGTASDKSRQLEGPRAAALNGELSRVAACGGRAKVVVFSSSSASTVTLFEGRIALVGATDQAKARRMSDAVRAVSQEIGQNYIAALPSLDAAGSDPVAQMRLFAEWRSQLGSGEFRMLELTDGMQNIGTTVEDILDSSQAASARFTVPGLAGAEVTFAGIGEVVGRVPPTTVVDALKAFYAELCNRSGAKRCRVVSEVAGASS